MTTNDFEWTDEAVALLRKWDKEGLTMVQQAKLLGVSKYSVAGKRNRIGLADPLRSPIIRDKPTPAKPPKMAERFRDRPSLPSLISAANDLFTAATAAEPIPPPKPYTPRVKECCWPIGTPGRAGFHYCAGEAMQGRPYCHGHTQLAYVKVREREPEAVSA